MGIYKFNVHIREPLIDASDTFPACFTPHRFTLYHHRFLFVIAKEDLDGQPTITANLEAFLQVAQLIDLLRCKLPAIELEVLLDAVLVDGLGNDTPALLQPPHQENLLRSFALLLSDLEKGRVLVERRVGGTQARVTRAVNALRSVIGDQLGRWIARVQFDLVDGGHNLGARIIEEAFQVPNAKIGHPNVSHLAGGWQLLHLLPFILF